MAVKQGDKIKVEYTGTFDDGTVFDSTDRHGGEPLEFEAGAGQVIKGFDSAVIGMEIGQEKDVKILSTDAYGDPNPQMVQKVPKERIPVPEGAELKAGMMLGMQLPTGQQLPVRITDVSDTHITIDANHPLAGKTLNFKLKIAGIEQVE